VRLVLFSTKQLKIEFTDWQLVEPIESAEVILGNRIERIDCLTAKSIKVVF